MSSTRLYKHESRIKLNQYLALLLAIFVATMSPAQQLRQGVSVQMAHTSNATPFPAADRNDAWVVAVTADGDLYFGVKPVTPEQLSQEMKATPRHRDAKLYIKPDARARFSDVEKVLSITSGIFFDSAVLLTAQSESPALGKLVAPKGLEVYFGSSAPDQAVVEINPGKSAVEVTLNSREVHLADLQSLLNQALQGHQERVVVVKPASELPFAQVAQVIDACSTLQAKIVLPVSTN